MESSGRQNGKPKHLQQNKDNPKPSPQSWDGLILFSEILHLCHVQLGLTLPFWHLSGKLHFRLDLRSVPGKEIEIGREVGGERENSFLTLFSWSLLGFMLLVFRETFRSCVRQTTQKAEGLKCSRGPELQCILSTVVFKTTKQDGLFVLATLNQAAP